MSPAEGIEPSALRLRAQSLAAYLSAKLTKYFYLSSFCFNDVVFKWHLLKLLATLRYLNSFFNFTKNTILIYNPLYAIFNYLVVIANSSWQHWILSRLAEIKFAFH